MLALPAPFGANAVYAAHLQLTVIGADFDTTGAAEACRNFGCAPQFVPRILSVLKASGRYDCYLQASWVKDQQRSAEREFATCGLRFHIDHWLEP